MKLKEYLDKFGIPVTAFAKRTGMCGANVHRILQGNNMRLDLAWNIVQFTKGAVSFGDLYSDLQLKKKEKKPRNKAKKKKAEKAKG